MHHRSGPPSPGAPPCGRRNRRFNRPAIASDGVVCGYGLVDGRPVYAYAQDFTSRAGSLGEVQARKICKVMDMAMKSGVPIVGINDSGGARIQEGIDALAGISAGDLLGCPGRDQQRPLTYRIIDI